MKSALTITFLFFLIRISALGQVGGTPPIPPNPTPSNGEDQLGAWYMYFWTSQFNDGPWGLQGDIQLRYWDIIGEREAFVARSGLTYQPGSSGLLLTLGYAYMNSKPFGQENITINEHRVYQELLFPHKLGRFHFTHRGRFEQRIIDEQDFRTRVRYNLMLDIPLNKDNLNKGAIYLAIYNEIFINGQQEIGNGNTVEYFDEDRLYFAVGHSIKDNLRLQIGVMRQFSDSWARNLLQFSLHYEIK